jgi:outer membrane protein OmpA-like peptidoglycan-associated protein
MKKIACTIAAICAGIIASSHPVSAAEDQSDTFAARLKLQHMKSEDQSGARIEATRSLSVITSADVRPQSAAATAKANAMAMAPDRPAIALATVDTSGAAIVVPAMTSDAMISQPVLFQHNSAFLTDQARDVLQVYCESIQKFEATTPAAAASKYVLIGHADASGDAQYNLILSRKRAEEARRFMISSCAIPEFKLRAAGLGEERLFDQANPQSSSNRRVELQLGS